MMPDADTLTDMTPQRQLTGTHVLLMVIAFFGILIAVNGVFIYTAVDTFRGEDVERSYRQGLDYNDTLDARRTQALLGWSAEVVTADKGAGRRRVRVNLRGTDGEGVSFDEMSGVLRHPVDTALDIPIIFERSSAPQAEVSAAAGRWVLIATAQKGDASFTFRKDIIFK